MPPGASPGIPEGSSMRGFAATPVFRRVIPAITDLAGLLHRDRRSPRGDGCTSAAPLAEGG